MTLQNTAEGGADGTTVTVANSGGGSGDAFAVVSAGSGGSITYSTASAVHGSLGYTLTQPTSGTACLVELRDSGGGQTSFSVRCYLTMDALPSATVQGPMMLRTTADASLIRVDMQSTGKLQLSATASALALAVGTTYRLEWYGSGLNGSGGSWTCDAYVGDSTALYTTVSLASQTTSGLTDRVRFGKMAGGATWGPLRFDDLVVNLGSSTPVGPVAGPTPTMTFGTTLTIGT